MALREVVDDAGRLWIIYAIIPESYDDRIGIAQGYQRGWLCFQSSGEKWRYLGIPDSWDALEDMQLLGLLSDAIKAPSRLDGSWRS